ncbi:MAG: yaiI [Alphaproteobacteria bacterium]|nr:yaiI [Alphaproteobacteria bacterium]
MKIWVDADACPKVIKDILFRVAERTGITVTLIANRYLSAPPSSNIYVLQVEDGFDIADNKIVELCEEGDLVITADIPLAALAVGKGAFALNPRGDFYDANNIGAILSMRNFMHAMRSGMPEPGDGPAIFTNKNREAFASQLDRFIARKR